jgi:hypothetical protein
MAAHRRNVQAMVIDEETQTSLLNIGNTRDTAEENTRQREYQREPITRDQHLRLDNLPRTNHVSGTTMTVPQTQQTDVRAVSFEQYKSELSSPMLMSEPQGILSSFDSMESGYTESLYPNDYSEEVITSGGTFFPPLKPALKYAMKPAHSIRNRAQHQNTKPTRAKMIPKRKRLSKNCIKSMIIKAEGKPLNYSSAIMEEGQLVPLIDHLANWKMKEMSAMYADSILASQKINYEPKEPMDKRGHGKDGRARSSGRVFF